MRPVFDPRFFPGLPKFLWFDDGSGGDSGGGGGDASGPGGDAASTGGGTGATTGVGSGAAPGTSTTSADAAATGMGGVGSAGQAASVGGSSDAASAFGGGGAAGPSDSATGFGGSVGMGPGTASSGAGPAGGVGASGGTGAATGAAGGGGGGGPGAATGGGGTGGPGAATGGGGGTAAGGSGISASVRSALQALLGGNPTDALRGAVRNSQLDFGPPGFADLGVPEGVGGPGAAPTGVVTVSPLGPPSPNLVSLAQQLFGSTAAQAARGSGSSTAAPANPTQTAMLRGKATLGTGDPNASPTNMGYPSIEGVSPGLTAAPAGPTQGSPSVIGPAGPNGPSAFASNAENAPAPTSGLGSAAPASQAVSSPASPNAPTQPDIGGLLQLVMSLVLGGNPGPQLTQLAAQARPQLASTAQAGA